MPFENPSDSVPMPARLVERALDLARAEVGLALVHTRRIAVRAVSALLGTIVACAFAQLAIVLLVAWPVIGERVSTPSLLAGIGISVVFSLAGAASAFVAWSGAREKKPGTAHGSTLTEPAPEAELVAAGAGPSVDVSRNVVVSRQRRSDAREEPAGATLVERLGS